MMPLIFNFDVPMAGSLQPFPDRRILSKLQEFQEMFNVQINFKKSVQDGSVTVAIRANNNEDVQKVKQATMQLAYFCTGRKVRIFNELLKIKASFGIKIFIFRLLCRFT